MLRLRGTVTVSYTHLRMLLRIEDLDPQRSRAAYAEQLRRDLGWLGLDWDGEMPPQSTRSPVYAAHFAKLEEQGLIYPLSLIHI